MDHGATTRAAAWLRLAPMAVMGAVTAPARRVSFLRLTPKESSSDYYG
jgi:hypothetical protein